MPARPGKNAVLEQLAADGVRYVFGNPGTVEQGLLDVLETAGGPQYVLALAEPVAVGVADGYARGAGAPAVVQLHSGVGLGNAVGMLYQAHRGHSPLVVLAGEAGVAYEAMDAQMACDLVAMARPVTKAAFRVVHPRSVLRMLRRAVKVAMTPPRGPVFLGLPMDVLDELTDEPAVPSTVPQTGALPPAAALARAADLLAGARAPVVLMGDGVAVSGGQQALADVVDLLGAPVWGLDCSEVNLPAGHPAFRGQLGHMFGEVSRARVADADAVLVVGTSLFPEVFPLLESPFRPGARVVQIDLDAHELAKNFPVDLALLADPAVTLEALAVELRRRGRPPAPLPPAPPAATGPAQLERFAAAVARGAPEPPVVFDEALTASPALAARLGPRDPGSWFSTRGGSLGVGIPGAIGLKLARPDREVIGFTGDGGSMYTVQALWTAARHDVPARFVICNNGRYRLLDDNLEQYWRERGVAAHRPPSGFDLSRPPIDFCGLARALGVEAARVDKPEEVEDVVARMLAAPGPFLVDLRTA